MSKRLALFAMLAAPAMGCATQEGYEKVVKSYLGAPEASLIEHWGPPDQVYNGDAGTKYLTYSRSRSGYVPGTPPAYQTSCSVGFCTSIPVGGSSGYAYTDTCKTSFKVVRGTITSWRFQGNDCMA
jgi:hypothetical protein